MPARQPQTESRAPKRSHAAGKTRPLALDIAEQLGLTTGRKTTHVNAKVPPRLFAAAARRAGSTSPAIVITAALAALATEDELGPWLARHWGALADIDPDLLAQLDP
jgi:hypothetical protein